MFKRVLLLSAISLASVSFCLASSDTADSYSIKEEQKRRALVREGRIREEGKRSQERLAMAAEDRGGIANITPYYANEEKYAELLNESMRTNDKAMVFSLLTHRHDELLTTIKRGDILRLAGEYGLSFIVEKLLKDKTGDAFLPQYLIDVPHGIFGAAKGGHIQTMAYLLGVYRTQSEGAKQLVVNRAFYEAAVSKKIGMVVYLLAQPFDMPLPVLSAEQLANIQKIKDKDALDALEKRKQANEKREQALETSKMDRIIENKLFPVIAQQVARGAFVN